MATILDERVTLEDGGDGLLRVRLVQVHANGVDLGGQIVLERSAAPWLAACIEQATSSEAFTETNHRIAPDHFRVYVGGSDMQPFVHVHNRRDAAAPFGKVYALGFSVSAAEHLAGLLQRVNE